MKALFVSLLSLFLVHPVFGDDDAKKDKGDTKSVKDEFKEIGHAFKNGGRAVGHIFKKGAKAVAKALDDADPPTKKK